MYFIFVKLYLNLKTYVKIKINEAAEGDNQFYSWETSCSFPVPVTSETGYSCNWR